MSALALEQWYQRCLAPRSPSKFHNARLTMQDIRLVFIESFTTFAPHGNSKFRAKVNILSPNHTGKHVSIGKRQWLVDNGTSCSIVLQQTLKFHTKGKQSFSCQTKVAQSHCFQLLSTQTCLSLGLREFVIWQLNHDSEQMKTLEIMQPKQLQTPWIAMEYSQPRIHSLCSRLTQAHNTNRLFNIPVSRILQLTKAGRLSQSLSK